ncbi:MAG TPA: hypothetical protein VHZ96_25615 [Frankiaceae bacterium]|jgi:hypothetical protein|nr:hypothetical protein [Frankiaceae bacterium]
MKWHARRLSLAAAGAVIAVTTTGCGDHVTGPHYWQTVLTHSVRNVPSGNNTVVVYDTLKGRLIGAGGQQLASTLVLESCNRKFVGGVLEQDWNCTAVINTGDRAYVFGGHANGMLGELPSLASPHPVGALFLTALGAPPPSPLPNPFSAQVLIELGGPPQ